MAEFNEEYVNEYDIEYVNEYDIENEIDEDDINQFEIDIELEQIESTKEFIDPESTPDELQHIWWRPEENGYVMVNDKWEKIEQLPLISSVSLPSVTSQQQLVVTPQMQQQMQEYLQQMQKPIPQMQHSNKRSRNFD